MKILATISIFASAVASIFTATSAFAADGDVVKVCVTTITMPGEDAVFTTATVKKQGTGLIATLDQKKGPQKRNYDEQVSVFEGPVRAGLAGKVDDSLELNTAEMLVNHAMLLTSATEMKGIANAGFDLTQVRSAKVYIVGKQTKFGMSAIVEAKDEAGKVLGSFLGGFLVNPCE